MVKSSKIRFPVFILVSILTILPKSYAKPVGFSYVKFSGPVSGHEQQIYVHDEHDHDHPHVDYIAKPDYQFSYGVDDPKSKVQQYHKETRYGDSVQGEYSLVEADGTLRVVKYTADDKNGFQAQVLTDGKPNPSVNDHIEVPVLEDNASIHEDNASIHEEESPGYSEHNDSSYTVEHSTEEDGHGEYQEIKTDDDSSSYGFEDSSF